MKRGIRTLPESSCPGNEESLKSLVIGLFYADYDIFIEKKDKSKEFSNNALYLAIFQ